MYATTRPVGDAVSTVHVCPVCGDPFASAAALSARYRGAGLLD